MNFYFTLNLQRLAKLSVATSFWESEKVKTKVKEYFYKHDSLKAEDEWTKITKSATDLLERTCFPLPSEMYAELVCIIRDIGLKIHDWFDSIKYMVLSDGVSRKILYDLYMKKIYWTHYGRIDGLRILKEAWMNIPEDPTGVIFTMGCLCCVEDDIYKLWRKLPQSLRNKIWKSRNDLYESYGCYMLLYWLESQIGGYLSLKQFNTKILEAEGECNECIDDGQSPEANMLIFSAYKGYGRAVKYFWENISPYEQNDNVVDALTCALKGLKNVSANPARHFYRKEQLIETYMYLMIQEQLSKSDMQEAIKLEDAESEIDIECIIHLFVKIWPWWENFSSIFNSIQPFLTDKDYDDMFTVVVDYYSKDLKNRVYQRMIRSIWQSKPNDLKITLEQKHFDCLLDAWDLTSLKMIFNDPSVSGLKAEFMKFVIQKMLSFLNNNEEEKIDEFVKEVLSVEEENQIYVWILKCDVKNLTNLYSDEKFKNIKSDLDAELICKYFITKNEFDMADKFLKWKFDSAKSEIRNLKFDLRNSAYTQEYILDSWRRSKDVKEAKNKSNKFLNWFLTQKEIGPFKKKHVIQNYKTNDEGYRNLFLDQFVKKDRFEMVEPLMVWCGIEEKYVARYRRFLIKACALRYLENNKIDLAEKLFVSAKMGEKSRNKFIQDLISSDQEFSGSLKRFIANCDDENENLLEVFTGFINFWIKPTGFGEKITRKLISWKERIKILNGREINYKKIRNDRWLSGKYTNDSRDRKKELDRIEIYSSDKKIDLFISVLDSLENDDASIKSLSVCRLFWDKISQNGENGEEKSDDKDKEEESSAYDSDNRDDEDCSDSEKEDEEDAEDNDEEGEDDSSNLDADGAETDEG